MERCVLNINEIKPCTFKKYDEKIFSKNLIITAKFGQLKPLILNESHEIIDGNYLHLAMKKLNYDTAECIILQISKEDEFKLKMALTFLIYDIDNLMLGEYIDTHIKNKQEAINLTNMVNMTHEEILRFKKLGEIDWQKELKKAEFEKKQQQTLFDDF